VAVNNQIIQEKGSDEFFLPHVGLELERVKQDQTVLATVDYEINIADIASTNEADLTRLGRLFPDTGSMRLKFDLLFSQYLEPLLWPAKWANPDTPRSSTLAHELALRFQGQYAMGTRLNPQRQRTVGGLYSVRGYDESLLAADTVMIANIEYRLHIPRLFKPDANPPTLFGEPFRWAPQHVYGRPDWDLMVRGFFDVGSTIHSDKQTFEKNDLLYSTGAGVEVSFKRNLSFRLDWGYVLSETETFGAEVGDSRFHVVGTVLY
jgi:outer membrane protein assembly factor BamA